MNAPADTLPRIEPVSLTLYERDFEGFAQALLHDPARKSMFRGAMKDMVESFIPHSK